MAERQIAVIAALAKNRVIGRDGRIPWDLPEDRAHFREITMGHVIVTFEEIGQPLPGRITYLLSSTKQVEEENCHTVVSLAEVLRREPDRDIFICGGASLYREALLLADRLYLTELSWEVEGDTFFPELDRETFRLTARQEAGVYCDEINGNRIVGEFSFAIYERQD